MLERGLLKSHFLIDFIFSSSKSGKRLKKKAVTNFKGRHLTSIININIKSS